MDRQQADKLVRELGERLGLPELALEPNGVILVSIGGGETIVTVGHSESRGTLDLMICLDTINVSTRVMLDVLAANFAWTGTEGGTFAIDPVSRMLVLQRRCDDAGIANGGLFAAFETLVATAEAWRSRLPQAMKKQNDDSETSNAAIPAGMVRA
jgi:hypothetical protein